MKKHLSTILLVLLFFVGLSVVLYPTVSDWWNQRHASRAIAGYDETAQSLTPENTDACFAAADDYNARLAADPDAFYDPEKIAGYEDTLNISGTGIMGYITIDKINVQLPIYHGTSDSVLQVGVGHLEGTSLPVGGASTHCVLSAHRGLPSAVLFTNLDRLEAGDTFTVTVLDRLLTYEVDQISIVLPEQVQDLLITDGQDYMTLMTCTPYGVNTHRLLVSATRSAIPDEIPAENDAVKDARTIGMIAGVATLVLGMPLVWLRRKPWHIRRHAAWWPKRG